MLNFKSISYLIYLGYILISCSQSLRQDQVSIDLRLNPHGTAPLSAEAIINIDHQDVFDIKISIFGLTNPDVITLEHYFSNRSKQFSLPILGLYPDAENKIQLSFIKDTQVVITKQETIVTEPLSTNLTVPIEIYQNQLGDDPSVFLIDNLPFAFDQHGMVRWAYDGDYFLNYGKLANGHLLIMSGEDLRFDYHYKHFYEVTMLGEIVQTYDLSQYYGHHDVWEIQKGKYQGDLLVAVNEAAPSLEDNAGEDGVNEEDFVFLISRKTGKIIKQWDIKKLFDQNNIESHRLPKAKTTHPDDWIHLNSLYYDDIDNSVIFSARHQSAVVKYDFESGKLIWILADNSQQQWAQQTNAYGQVISEYLLQAVDEDGHKMTDTGKINFWPYGQHAAKRVRTQDPDFHINQENILLYDNGNYRNFFQYGLTKDRSKSPLYSRAVEYIINKKTMSVYKGWEFDYDRKYFTVATGGVDLLENNHRLIGFMWTSKDKQTPRIVQLDEKDRIVFEARINYGKKFYYQVEKFNLYQGID